MKNKTKIWLLVPFLVLGACKKKDELNKRIIAQIVGTGSIFTQVTADYDAIIHILHSPGGGGDAYAFFKTNIPANGANVGFVNIDGTNLVPNAKFRYSLTQNLFTNQTYDVYGKVTSFYNKNIHISFGADSTNGYTSFDTIVSTPSFIQGTSPTHPDQCNITIGQPFTINWVGANPNDYLILDLSWGELKSPKGSSYIDGKLLSIADNGSYTIPWSLLQQFDPSGNITVSIDRYTADEFKSNGKKIVVIAQTSGGFGTLNFPGTH